ncbi:restriction endonuclease subunit S [Methanobrevibacter smithii]|uniref:restriction endonuclease subunit S n=1 Tax=Methanobrevibacter smithii TaxID=2173 RepID=UPI001EE51670|nr:restriction endonuclease subunit S [Methanobrevibacter smithii]
MVNLSLEWKTVTLGSCCNFQEGYVNPSQKNPEYFDGDVKWVRAVDLNDSYVYETSRTLTRKGYESAGKSALLFKPNTIVISKSGTVGRLGIIKDYMCGNRATINIVPYEDVSMKFIFYILKNYQRHFKDMAVGSVQKNLYVSILENLEISLPSIDTQNKIAKILSNIDDKIDCIQKINKNLQELAKSIYRYHFIDFEPYSQDNFISSTLGEIPENWCVQSIGEFVDDMKNGGTPKRGESDYWDNGTVPWLKTGEINNNIIIKSEEHITESGLKNSSAKLLPINSIIIALYGKGTAARIGLLKLEATTNQACCAMICEDFNKALFLYLFLLFNQKEIENLASGSVQQNLSKDLITNLELVVPPTEIIEKLPFKEIYDKISNNYFEIEYLTNLRDTLLPKLMSGEIDVSKINCDLELKYNYMKYLFNQIHTPMSNSVV